MGTAQPEGTTQSSAPAPVVTTSHTHLATWQRSGEKELKASRQRNDLGDGNASHPDPVPTPCTHVLKSHTVP